MNIKLFKSKNKLSLVYMYHLLKKKGISAKPIVLKKVDSTNAYAKKLVLANQKNIAFVISDTQTSGRGRLGRDFFSPSGTGIYMSIIINSHQISFDISLLTVAACVAVCTVLESYTGMSADIKWVNDIFLNGKKICGILTEGITPPGSAATTHAIVGVGINLKSPDNGFPADLQKIAGAVSSEQLNRNEIATEIYEAFFKLCNEGNTERIISEYSRRSIIIGKKIRFDLNGTTTSALAVGINEFGNLIAELDNKQKIIIKSGEISLGSANFAE